MLILKDSYQCPLTDYLSALFSSVTVIDPRFDNPPLKQFVEEEEIDLVILMYHQNNFLTELSEYISESYND